MARIEYPASSPYFSTPQQSWRIGRYVDRPIPASTGDKIFLIDAQYQYRPDRLAYDLYQNPMYWWVFMQRNIDVIRDPIWDFKAGLEIIVPSLDDIRTYLGG